MKINWLRNLYFPRRAPKLPSKRSLLLISLLFIVSMTITPVVAQVTHPTSIVQTQNNFSQLATQARKSYQAEQYETAASLWRQTAKAYEAVKDPLNQAMALSNLSLTYQQLGKWEQARRAIAQSLKLLETAPKNSEKQQVIAQSLDIQGRFYREIGQASEALNSWQQATKIYQQLDRADKVTQSKINQGQAMEDLGYYPRACKTLLSILKPELEVRTCKQLNQLTTAELSEKLDKIEGREPSLSLALATRNLGDLLREIGQLEQSARFLDNSLTTVQKLDSPQEQAAIYLSMVNTAQALVEREKVRSRRRKYERQTLDSYERAIQLSSSPTTRQQAQLNLFSYLLPRQKWKEAESLWRSLSPKIDSLPPSHDNIYAQINLAHNLTELLNKDNSPPADFELPTVGEINQILTKAIKNARQIGDKRAEAYALGDRGRLYELTRQLSQAEKDTRQAISLVSNFESPDIAYQYFWQLGRIGRLRNDLDQSIAAYTKAYNALQALRRNLAIINPEVQFSFRDRVEPVYRELVELNIRAAKILDKAGNKEETKERLTQARTVIESLQLAELNNFFREACVDANPQQIDEIDPNAAVIYPIILSDQLEVLLSLPNQAPRLFSSKTTQQEVEKTVEAILNSLTTFPNKKNAVENSLALYQQVYDWLIRPLETELVDSQVQTIAFVLDKDLRNIPMSILHDGKKYLVEKYALALAPGLQLLDPTPLANIELEVFTAGLSEIRTDFPPHRNFGPLPKVPEELAQIQQLGLTEKILLNKEFTLKTLKQEMTDFDSSIVHLATHAKFSSQAEDTFILAWDDQIDVRELDELLRDDTLNRLRAIELLVLSACETASGDNRATLGLAGVAVKAGARSTLATLWSVEDESTAKIMGEFYRQLIGAEKAQGNKAEALRQAQLTLIQEERFNHPHFWSPFVLVGNWQ